MRTKAGLFLLLLLCGTVPLQSALGKGKKAKAAGPPKMPPAMVVVEPVHLIKNTVAREYIGNIEAAEEVDIQPRISGFITDIKFKEGSMVKKGDLLF